MGDIAGINKLDFVEDNGKSQTWQVVDVVSTNPKIATSVAMGIHIKTVTEIDADSIKFLVKKILNKNPDAKLLVIDLSNFPQINCCVDGRDQRKMHKDSKDKFSKDLLKELDSKEPGIPTIFVNINIPFTGLMRIITDSKSNSDVNETDKW